MSKFHKLIRDEIPEIIRSQGSKCTVRELNETEFVKALRAKLHEEVEEFLNAATSKEKLEEAADILEVLKALVESEGGSMQEVEEIRQRKAKDRGAFDRRLLLLDVEESANA